jgi:Na+-transporting NADH:ubiquinone oxidoreductase subunit A
MSKVIRLTRGYDIPIAGKAGKKVVPGFTSRTYSVKPTDFHGLAPIPKLLVSEQTEVKAGDPLFYDKSNEAIKYCAPVSGEVVEIRRGDKRAIEEVVILADSETKYRDFGRHDIGSLGREQIVSTMIESGAWLFLRERPYDVPANPEEEPRDIFISGFDSSPLAADINFIMEGRGSDFQEGLAILSKLTSGSVHLSLNASTKPCAAFNNATGVEIHWFQGAHPAGNLGVQIHHIKPINKGEVVWTIHPEDVANLAVLFREGKYSPERTVALTGPEVSKPAYYKTIQGASIAEMVKGNIETDSVRYISGNVLTGKKISADGHIGFHDRQVSVIYDDNEAEMLGWLFPSYPRPTRSMTYWAYANEAPAGYRVTTSNHGEERAFVVSGQYEDVLPMDIYPVHLLKAIMARDFDLMEGLGIYEIIEEDFALCEFVCTSKISVMEIVREGLDYMHSQN